MTLRVAELDGDLGVQPHLMGPAPQVPLRTGQASPDCLRNGLPFNAASWAVAEASIFLIVPHHDRVWIREGPAAKRDTSMLLHTPQQNRPKTAVLGKPLFPFYRSRRLRSYIVYHSVHSRDLRDNSLADAFQGVFR